ncbi:PA2779 family protein [Thioalkalivibrio sp. XN279]|uniref:PA2779 family protein n=1 Tax=Thioalkalivibrio sp. XN279 TaxID=2714953 RepID=UPI001407879B|nr:PA2779 family protein [Thioalkalivibrio sp. XN279]NHA14650.1 PA2779 family protein [Thioalkalivibrio sp. XN279]
MRNRNSVVIALTLAAMLVTSMPAAAGIVGTEQMVAEEARSHTLDRIDVVLAGEAVEAQLLAWGVSPDMVRERMATMSDLELRQLADSMETAPAGGDVLAVIGVVFVVLFILEVTGVINIFSRI